MKKKKERKGNTPIVTHTEPAIEEKGKRPRLQNRDEEEEEKERGYDRFDEREEGGEIIKKKNVFRVPGVIFVCAREKELLVYVTRTKSKAGKRVKVRSEESQKRSMFTKIERKRKQQ